MGKWWICAVAATAMLSGCSTVQHGSIPVTNSASSLAADDQLDGSSGNAGYRAPAQAPRVQSAPEDSGVVVMVPGGSASTPIQSYPAGGGFSQPAPITTGPITTGPAATGSTYNVPSAPSGIPSSGGLAADEQLDGPVLALLSTAQQQQSGGDLNGASSSLERAQRIAPREPQVLYRLAEVRLAQGDAAQAEQLARRGLTLSSGRPTLQASFWNIIAQSRDRQGDAAGAAQARQNARVNI
ncbi:tetratricopeptide repeat protein [Pseudomonas sp. LRF_L74]|uniref:tetratricopeptide repeat protein n=1 Tax=Pseudomonas sp. LRF_L74 TaxID=3369422 RepID=UPI003F62E32D